MEKEKFVYPIAFMSIYACIAYKGKQTSEDGSPHYIINPNAKWGEYSYNSMMEMVKEGRWVPITTKNEMKLAKIAEKNNEK